MKEMTAKSVFKRKFSVVFALVAAAIAALSIAVSSEPKSVAISTEGAVRASVKSIDDAYYVGDAFTVPQADIFYDGKSYPSESAVVVFPSGRAIEKQSFVLSEGGEYTVVYSATANGKKITAEAKFAVYKAVASFTGDKSTSRYGTHPVYAQNKTALLAEIARGETLEFHQPINLAELDKKDAKASFFVTPSQIGVPDATNVRIRFTDAYDETNYVEVELRDVSFVQGDWAIHHTYTMAKSSIQPYKGIEGANVHYNDPYGHPCEFSLAGVPMNGGEPGSEEFVLEFDYGQKKISDKAGMIIDLDDAAYFTELWSEGFTTGECFISVYAEMYQATHVKLGITSMFGLDLSARGFYDRQGPTITVDTKGMSESALPHALAGAKYRVFSAEAYDVQDGACEVESYVTYDSDGTEVNVDVRDGEFVASRAGTYKIRYYATDRSGNRTVKELVVECPADGEAMSLSVVNPNGEKGEAGGLYKVCDSVSCLNASGDTKISVTAKDADGKTYDVSSDDFTFVPMRGGVYTVTVSCEDYIRRAEKTFTVEIGPSDKPRLFDTPELPSYFIFGAQYRLPMLDGYEFTTGEAVKKRAEIFVSEDEADTVPVSNGVYRVRAERNVRVIYSLKTAGDETSVCRDIPVVDVGYGAELRYAEFFHTIAGSIDKTQNALDLELGTHTDASAAEFVNALAADKFEFSFNVNGAKNNFTGLRIDLRDGACDEQAISVYFTKGRATASVDVNGGQKYVLTSNFNGNGDNFLLAYDADSYRLRLSPTFTIPIDKYSNGSAFDGFTSGKIYMSITFEGVTGESAINVFSLNDTGFSDFDSDFFAPTISCKDMRGNKGLGETVVLSPAAAFDVLDPNVTFTLCVTGPDKQPVTSEEGIVLDETCDPGRTYTIRLSEYGVYMVMYEAKDTSGNTVGESYGISVVDTVAPQISLKGGYVTSAKKDDVVTVAEYTVSDDNSENPTVHIFLVTPYGTVCRLEGNAFKAIADGTYTVMYTVYDENNNFAMIKYDVKVA